MHYLLLSSLCYQPTTKAKNFLLSYFRDLNIISSSSGNLSFCKLKSESDHMQSSCGFVILGDLHFCNQILLQLLMLIYWYVSLESNIVNYWKSVWINVGPILVGARNALPLRYCRYTVTVLHADEKIFATLFGYVVYVLNVK